MANKLISETCAATRPSAPDSVVFVDTELSTTARRLPIPCTHRRCDQSAPDQTRLVILHIAVHWWTVVALIAVGHCTGNSYPFLG